MTELLKTQRLEIRPFLPEDRPALAVLLRNDEIKKTYMLPDFADDAALDRMVNVFMNASASDKHFTRGIFLENRLIGFVNDTEIRDDGIEFGYVIHPDFWGRGYATEMFRAVIDECFRGGFPSVRAAAFRENPASFRVMEKSGMRKTSRLETIKYRGKTHDCIYYEIQK